MGLVQNVQSAFRLAENEKMSLVQNVQSAFQLVEIRITHVHFLTANV